MGTQVRAWDAAGAERAVAVLKAVADPSRYRLLWALSGQELPVSALAELLGAHVAATSQHLARLRAAGLVTSRREGTRMYYRAAGGHVRGLLEEATLAAEDAGAGPGSGGGSGQDEAAPVRQEQRQPARARRTRPATGQ
ncbi:ArsR/SmtB family transcription factor [Streptomyces sp. CBMA29]|uniref:ArsR/SmtB family transcription factor n=1 Tax=Streptomyces sp. CBMA29 TaxID=1896314 RepID=UPI001661D505|nr:metalloregulator ArsR/SmtB family transcription factor [Streptomyces sp. CBMA29]MBD0739334.1 transcriptional regulator [Streptomyces sp. CBMA29]